MRSPIRALFAAATMFAAASRAPADTIALTFDHTTGTAGVPVQYTINGTTSSPTVTPGPYFWHPTNGVPLNSGFSSPLATFCVELNQSISANNSYTYTIDTNLAAMPTIGTTVKANQIEELWGRYYDPNWANPAFAGSLQSTAFQLALWELVYDGGSNLNLTSGNFQSKSGSVSNTGTATGLAASWLSSLSSTGSNAAAFNTRFNGYDLVGLTNGTRQDQITMIQPPPPTQHGPVPAPPAVILAGIGFIGLVGRARMTRQAA